MKLGFEDQR